MDTIIIVHYVLLTILIQQFYNVIVISLVATFGKILGNFSLIVPPSAAGVRSRRFRREGRLVAGVGTF